MVERALQKPGQRQDSGREPGQPVGFCGAPPLPGPQPDAIPPNCLQSSTPPGPLSPLPQSGCPQLKSLSFPVALQPPLSSSKSGDSPPADPQHPPPARCTPPTHTHDLWLSCLPPDLWGSKGSVPGSLGLPASLCMWLFSATSDLSHSQIRPHLADPCQLPLWLTLQQWPAQNWQSWVPAS